MKNVIIRDRDKSNNDFINHLKFLVICNDKIVGEHANYETALQHKNKILTSLPIPSYKGKKLL